MQPDLERFLDANDPAELVAARRAIVAVDAADAETLHVIVADWRDEQAAVNLLLYPDLLPEDDRTPALAEGLSGSHGDDAVLAACVGLAAWVAADDDAPAIAERLLRLVLDDATSAPIAVHASVALGAYAEHVAPTDLVCALVHDDPTVRHNVLAAVLGGWGGVETLAAVRAAADAGLVPRMVADAVRDAVVGAGLGDVDEPIDDGRLLEPIATPDRRADPRARRVGGDRRRDLLSTAVPSAPWEPTSRDRRTSGRASTSSSPNVSSPRTRR